MSTSDRGAHDPDSRTGIGSEDAKSEFSPQARDGETGPRRDFAPVPPSGSISDDLNGGGAKRKRHWFGIKPVEWITIGCSVVTAAATVTYVFIANNQLSAMRSQLSSMQSGSTQTDKLIELQRQLATNAGNQADYTKRLGDISKDQLESLRVASQSAKQSADTAAGQLMLAESTQRAWLTISPRIAGEIRFDDPMSGIAWVPLNYTLENVGRRPAFHVSVNQWAVPYSKNLEKIQEERCREVGPPVAGQHGYGTVILPGDKVDNWNKTSIGDGIEYHVARKVDLIKSQNPNAEVYIWIVGCVAYDFGDAAARHHTGFIYRVAHSINAPVPGGKATALSFKWGERVAASDLILDSSFLINSLID